MGLSSSYLGFLSQRGLDASDGTGFLVSFYVWSLKTSVMQQSEQPSKEDFVSILLVPRTANHKLSPA